MSKLDELMQTAREANDAYVIADSMLDSARDLFKKAEKDWTHANMAREKAENNLIDYLRCAPDRPTNDKAP